MTRWAIAAGDFTPLGGMDRANHALARYLASADREVHLVAHRVWPDLVAMPGVVVHEAARPLGSHLLGMPLLSRKAGTVARRLGAGTRFLANGGNTPWRRATWIHYLHAAYEPDAVDTRARITGSAGRRRALDGEARAVSSATRIICNSDRTADDVRRHYGVAADRVSVVYYGTDAAQFGEATDADRQQARATLGIDPARPLAVFVGALGDRRKGFDVLFDAWVDLCADPAWDADLAVAGAGSELESWQRQAVERGIDSRIRFLGFRDDVATLLAAGDVIVHPSRYEAYGLAVHESLCRGLPAIVSAESGVAERLPPSLAALTLPSANRSTLVDRCRTWRSDACRWRREARTFGAQLRSRSWDDMARDIAALVECT
jgi:glycosyltransferase involved in cell wall biosynthesis